MEAINVLATTAQPPNRVSSRREPYMSSLLAQYAKNRDPQALQEIIQRHADLVYATCLRIVGDPHLADDAGQAVFLVFTQKAASLRPDTPLSAWFYRTAVYVAQRANRERRTRTRHEQEAAAMRAKIQEAAGESEVWQTLKPQLDTLLNALPSAERDAVVLRYLAGKTEPEAAKELGCPVGTLSARVSRAINRLRQRFAGTGTSVPAAILALALEHHATHAAPPHFVASLHAACLGTAGATATLGAKTLAEGTMKALFWMKIKVVAAVLLISALIGVPVTMKLAAGESAPVTHGDKDGPNGAAPAPLPLVIPKTVSFGPQVLKGRLLYERLTETTTTDRPPIMAVIDGLIPDMSDCQIYEVTTAAPAEMPKVNGELTFKFACIKAFNANHYNVQVDKAPRAPMNLFAYSIDDQSKMPGCRITWRPDGSTRVASTKDADTHQFKVLSPGLDNATLTLGQVGLGFLLLNDIGLAPFSSTGGIPRAVNDSWQTDVSLQEKYHFPIQYTLENLEIVKGRLIATLKSRPTPITLNPELLPEESVNIGATMLTLAPKSLTGQSDEEVSVDVERGVVIHHKRIVTAKLGYKLDLPETMPDAIRKMAGSDLVLGVRFTVDDTLLDEDQAKLLSEQQPAPEALKMAEERWTKRSTSSNPFTQEMAAGMIRYLHAPQAQDNADVKPQKDEF